MGYFLGNEGRIYIPGRGDCTACTRQSAYWFECVFTAPVKEAREDFPAVRAGE